MMEDKSEIYKKNLSKILQKLVVDVQDVVSTIELNVKLMEDIHDKPYYDVGLVVYYSKILSSIPRHKRLQKIKEYFDIPNQSSLWEYYNDIIKYVIPERVDLGLVNDIDLLP